MTSLLPGLHPRRSLSDWLVIIALGWVGLAAVAATPNRLPPTELPGLRYTNDFFPGTTYSTNVPSLADLLGFPGGERAVTSAEIDKCLKAWATALPDRTRLVEYARSHEGRPLHYLILTSPKNLTRLDEIEADIRRLGDPRSTDPSQAEAIIGRTPPVAWFAATIHGDETEGSDAALILAHHLLAATTDEVRTLLDSLVIIIDPLMNPDGRDRFVKMIAEHRGATPNLDDQSLLHAGYWPWGRGNHYLFDLNRDYLFAVHPETRGRIREMGRWNPMLFIDAHGMGPQETHLFSPPREPINPNIPQHRRAWEEPLSREQARAFDQRGLVYYTGEWAEEWYPGYTDSLATYRGGIGILYEQARIAADGVRRPEGRVLSYRESVMHHVIGAVANLNSVRLHARELLSGYRATRQLAVDPNGPYARRTFAVLPTANRSRQQALIDILQLHGFELHRATRDLGPLAVTDQMGRSLTNVTVPAGSLLIPNRQPLAHLLAAFLEFDPHLSPKALEEERREVLRTGGSRMYDSTAWNLTEMFGLPSLTIADDLPRDAEPIPSHDNVGVVPGAGPAAPDPGGPPPVAWIFDGADDLAVTVGARLLERGVQVRAALKDFRFDDHAFARGSILVTRLDNRTFAGDLTQAVHVAAAESGLAAVAVQTGLGAGELPDLGGSYFQRLEPLRVATAGREGASFTDYGSVWFTLDHRLAIRHSQLDLNNLGDLDRYNVLILPETEADAMTPARERLKDWVKNGGTLVAIGGTAAAFIREDAGFSKVRDLPSVLAKLADYELVVQREWLGRIGAMPSPTNIWAYQAATKIEYPWQSTAGTYPEEKELKKRDAWQALFMPAGAILATRIDTNHWLTAGCPEPLPILAGKGPVLMTADGAEAPVRFGYLVDAPTNSVSSNVITASLPAGATGQSVTNTPGDAASKDEKEKDKAEAARVGWAALPTGTAMQLRMSGLLWPEAAHRLANSAWVTRESLGRGQVILFASSPTHRAGARGAERVFLNAVVLGPGLGASTALRP
ncbi:MAG: hypothetical protein IT581_15435 [Verrucomicrobiales bacterium]|nr:hypothetical protein [Verrucomicrobiales bacterium]